MLKLGNPDSHFFLCCPGLLALRPLAAAVLQAGFSELLEFLDPAVNLVVADIVLPSCLLVIAIIFQAVFRDGYTLFLCVVFLPVFIRLFPVPLRLKFPPLLYTFIQFQRDIFERKPYLAAISFSDPLPSMYSVTA